MDYLYFKELYHHGIKGQKWGIRRFQNEDGSLTKEGEERYGISNEDFQKVKSVKEKADHKVYEDWDSGTIESEKNRNNLLKERKKDFVNSTKKFNDSKVFKDNNLELNCEEVKLDEDGMVGYKGTITNKNTGKKMKYEDLGWIAETMYEDIEELTGKKMSDEEYDEILTLSYDLESIAGDIDAIQEDPHYGRDNVERKYDYSGISKETIDSVNNALSDLKYLSKEENAKYVEKCQKRDRVGKVMKVFGYTTIAALVTAGLIYGIKESH